MASHSCPDNMSELPSTYSSPAATTEASVPQVVEIHPVNVDPATVYYSIASMNLVSQLFDAAAPHVGPLTQPAIAFAAAYSTSTASYVPLPEIASIPRPPRSAGARRQRNYTEVLEP